MSLIKIVYVLLVYLVIRLAKFLDLSYFVITNKPALSEAYVRKGRFPFGECSCETKSPCYQPG